MWSILKEIITSPAGSFGFVAALLIFVGWVIHYVTKKMERIDSDHDTLTKSTEKIEKFIDEIRKDLSYLKGVVDYKNDLAQSHSPVSLTKKGKDVSEEIGAESIIANNWSKIKSSIEMDANNKNAYDIQQYCMETSAVEPEKFFKEEDLNRLKLFAFKNGKSFQYYSVVLAILIRDRYFLEKRIDTNDVDRHKPTN